MTVLKRSVLAADSFYLFVCLFFRLFICEAAHTDSVKSALKKTSRPLLRAYRLRKKTQNVLAVYQLGYDSIFSEFYFDLSFSGDFLRAVAE